MTTKPERPKLYIRAMVPADFDEVLAIEAESEFPWDLDTFKAQYRQRNVIGSIGVHEGLIAGYAMYRFQRDRITLLNISVARPIHRCGIGTALMNYLKGKLPGSRRVGISCVTRETNLGVANFLKRQGFKAVLVPGHWQDTGEDGYSFAFQAEAVAPIVQLFREVYTKEQR